MDLDRNGDSTLRTVSNNGLDGTVVATLVRAGVNVGALDDIVVPIEGGAGAAIRR